MATAIDDNDADGQLDKSIWRLLDFRCTSSEHEFPSTFAPEKFTKNQKNKEKLSALFSEKSYFAGVDKFSGIVQNSFV